LGLLAVDQVLKRWDQYAIGSECPDIPTSSKVIGHVYEVASLRILAMTFSLIGRAVASGRSNEPLSVTILMVLRVESNDGFSLAEWVADKALLVKPVHRIPVEAFPGPALVMQRQVKQGQNGLVDFLLID
jgi:hypothetical protein